MCRTLLAAILLLVPAATLAQAPDAVTGQTAIREMIRRQLDSRVTEPPPTPVPGTEAEALRMLPPLPAGTGGVSRGGAAPAVGGSRPPP